jgi:hypothetical protein
LRGKRERERERERERNGEREKGREKEREREGEKEKEIERERVFFSIFICKRYTVQVQEEGVWTWQLVPQEPGTVVPLLSSASSPALATVSSLQAAKEVASTSSSNLAPNTSPYVRLRVIDNDTCEEYPSFLGCSPPRYELINKNYIIT